MKHVCDDPDKTTSVVIAGRIKAVEAGWQSEEKELVHHICKYTLGKKHRWNTSLKIYQLYPSPPTKQNTKSRTGSLHSSSVSHIMILGPHYHSSPYILKTKCLLNQSLLCIPINWTLRGVHSPCPEKELLKGASTSSPNWKANTD